MRKARTLERLARQSALVARPRGIQAILRKLGAHLRDGSGINGFLLWLRDAAAFERRDDVAAYRRWLDARAASRTAGQDRGDDPLQIVVSRGPGVERSQMPEVELSWFQASACADDYVLLTHPDAEVLPAGRGALLATALASNADVVYGDEDQGERGKPNFKPGFSIDLLRAEDYIGPVFLVRRTALERVAESRTSSSLELLLKLYETGARFEHTSELVARWRQPRQRLAPEAQRAASRDHLLRCYGPELGAALTTNAMANGLSVSIIIPTRDRLELLAPCIESLYGRSNVTTFDVTLVDNGTEQPDAKAWLERAPERFPDLRVLRADCPFNWSRLNNLGAREARGDLLLFLNNDIEVIEPNWLDQLALSALRPDIGAVGPLLLYPDGTIQHAGVVVGIGGFADHLYAGCDPDREIAHPFVHPRLPRNVLAVTGACLMLSRARFREVGGFDETFAICGDVELCLRLYRRGFLNLYDPRAVLVHHESATRSRAPLPPGEVAAMRPVLAEFLEAGDPYYNPRLRLNMRYPHFQD